MQIGERIRQIRIHKGLTQGELVSEVCSITYLSRIENGQIKLSDSFLEKVAEKLGIDIDSLLDTEKTDVECEISGNLTHRNRKGPRIEL